MSKKIVLSKEDINKYYIEENHSLEEASKYFGVSTASIMRFCKANNLHKDKEKKAEAIHKTALSKHPDYPSKEEMEKIYIEQEYSVEDAAKYFNMSKFAFIAWKNEFGIKKSYEQIGTQQKAKYEEKKKSTRPSAEDITQYFITELHTKEECAKHFNTSVSGFSRMLSYYGIHKTTQQVQDTIARITEEKYGKAFYKTEESKQKQKQTCIQKYGVDSASKTEEVRKKLSEAESFPMPSKEDLYQKYIVENCSTEECGKFFGVSRNLITKWSKKYGIVKDDSLRVAKIKQTNLEKYGVETPFQREECKKKIQQSNLAKYGVSNPTFRNIKHFDVWSNKDKFVEYVKQFNKEITAIKIAEYFNSSQSGALRKIHEYECEDLVDIFPMRSQFEDQIINFLYSLGVKTIDTNNRTLLGDGREVDIYLPDYKMGIEFDGEYFHSDVHKKYQDHGGRSTYHQEKSLTAESKGIFLFHIFEHEWSEDFVSKNPQFKNAKENIENRLRSILVKNPKRIAARKCEIREVDKKEKDKFFEENHIQGSEHHSCYYIGLYFEHKLVSCMAFGKSKYKAYDWELTRFANIHDTTVQGGASKLFTYFVDNVLKEDEKIVSYNDITKTKGTLYQTLGFTLKSINSPNYWWVNFDTNDVRSRYKEQKAGEVERMHSQNYHRICDCGTKTWIYTKNSI